MDHNIEMDTDTILEDADMEGDSSSEDEGGEENVEKAVYLPGKPLGCERNIILFWFCF